MNAYRWDYELEVRNRDKVGFVESRGRRNDDLNHVDYAGMSPDPATRAGATAALGAMGLAEMARDMGWMGIGALLRGVMLRNETSRRLLRYWQVRSLVRGTKPTLAQMDELLEEVSRYRWIEAQKAGFDVWSVAYPGDPEGGALAEWVRQYYGAWQDAASRRSRTVEKLAA